MLSRQFCFFFFQAEDGIRDDLVTGVQTCALPISSRYDGTVYRVSAQCSTGTYAVDRAVVTRGNIKLAVGIKRQPGGVHQVGEKGPDVVIRIDLVDGNRDLLSAASGKCYVDIAFRIQRGIGNRMQVLRYGLGDLDFAPIADAAVVLYGDLAGVRAVRHASNQESL